MFEVIGQTLLFAVGIAIFPIPIIAAVLFISTPNGKRNSLSYLAGWAAGLAIIGLIALTAMYPYSNGSDSETATWFSWFLLLTGITLIIGSFRKWHASSQREKDTAPAWTTAIADFSAPKSFISGAILSGLNPKNILLSIAAATVISQAGLTAGQETMSWMIFMLVASLGVIFPILAYFVLGNRSTAYLIRLRNWMERNNAAIVATIMLLVGTVLISNALPDLLAVQP